MEYSAFSLVSGSLVYPDCPPIRGTLQRDAPLQILNGPERLSAAENLPIKNTAYGAQINVWKLKVRQGPRWPVLNAAGNQAVNSQSLSAPSDVFFIQKQSSSCVRTLAEQSVTKLLVNMTSALVIFEDVEPDALASERGFNPPLHSRYRLLTGAAMRNPDDDAPELDTSPF